MRFPTVQYKTFMVNFFSSECCLTSRALVSVIFLYVNVQIFVRDINLLFQIINRNMLLTNGLFKLFNLLLEFFSLNRLLFFHFYNADSLLVKGRKFIYP